MAIKTQRQKKHFLELLLAFTQKELKVRYKKAILGFLWVFLNPLLQMLTIGFIFKNFIKAPIANYFLFLFTGLLPWNFFSQSLIKATPAIVHERNLIRKTKFIRELIPLSIVLSNFFHFLASLLLFFLYLFISGNILTNGLILITRGFFFSLLWLLAFTSGLSLFTSALNVKYRDVNFFVQAFLILWFYATPIIYSVEMLPQSYRLLFYLNPLAYPFEMLRYCLALGNSLPNDIFLTNLLLSLVIVFIGCLVFRKESKNFSDWL